MTKTKTAEKPQEKGLKVGDHQFPDFDGPAAVFGASRQDYPSREQIPTQFYNGHTPYNKAFAGLFFKGGKLADYGLSFKPGIDQQKAMKAIRALMSSFDPKHEIKGGTVAWALSEWCDYTPPKLEAA